MKAKPITMLTPPHGRGGRKILALLGSLCFFLSAIEYLIPKPLPFMRIGLANMPLLLALDIFSPAEFLLLALLKIFGQGIIGGLIFSHVFLFSIMGTFSSALVMFCLRRLLGKKHLGFTGLGCAGAMASNCAQLLLARYLIFGPALRYLAAPFLASGLVTGIGLGLVCEYFCRHSVWYAHAVSGAIDNLKKLTTEDTELHGERDDPRIKNSVKLHDLRGLKSSISSYWNSFNAEGLFIAGLLMALIFMFNRSIEIHIAQFLFFCLLAFLFRKKINLFATVIFTGSIVFLHLLAPFGKVLVVIGPLRITQGSLFAGIDKAITISGLVIISRVCVKSDLRLPGTIGLLLGESLRILELLRKKSYMSKRGTFARKRARLGIKRKQILSGLDQLMLEMETINIENTAMKKQAINVKSILLLSAMVIITAAMNFIPG